MVVLFFALEKEVLDGLDAPDRADFLKEAAAAYRARANCLRALGDKEKARLELARVKKLEAEAEKLAQKPAPGASSSAKAPAKDPPRKSPERVGKIRLVNAWSEPVVVLVDGVSFLLQPGEERAVIKSAGPFSYEVPVARHRARATLEADKSFLIRVRAQ